VLSGILTPLLPPLIDQIRGTPADFRIALVAIPFAVLVFMLLQRCWLRSPRLAGAIAFPIRQAPCGT
jgi:hypothetical protein